MVSKSMLRKRKIYETLTEVLEEHRSFYMGTAMAMVVLYHLFVYDEENKLLVMFYPGYLGIDVFLLLSGYGLCRSYQQHSLATFYKRRFVRLIPIYFLFATVVSVLRDAGGDGLSPWDWVCNLTTLSYWGAGGIIIDWYISTLILLYLFSPLLFRACKDWGVFCPFATLTFHVVMCDIGTSMEI